MMDIELLGKFVDRAIHADPPTDVRAACCRHGPAHGLYAPYYHLIYLLAQHMAPCTIVELGVHYGIFIHCAALACRDDNAIIGIDITHHNQVNDILSAHGNVMFINSASVPVPDGLINPAPTSIDILHIDSHHTYVHAKSEFEAYKHLLNKGAVVMFDDLYATGSDVLKYFDELPYPKIHDDRLHPVPLVGYGVMVYA